MMLIPTLESLARIKVANLRLLLTGLLRTDYLDQTVNRPVIQTIFLPPTALVWTGIKGSNLAFLVYSNCEIRLSLPFT